MPNDDEVLSATNHTKKPGAVRHPVRDIGLVHGLPTIDDDGLAGQIGTHV